jgi:hypothetical protein
MIKQGTRAFEDAFVHSWILKRLCRTIANQIFTHSFVQWVFNYLLDVITELRSMPVADMHP